jgi:hypothetical protein
VEWYAIYTKAGKGNVVSTCLFDKGIDVLNPKIIDSQYKHHKVIKVEEPLSTGCLNQN